MLKLAIRFLACVVVIFAVCQAHGIEPGLSETEGAIRTWRTDNGLPADSVSAIFQTRDGYLWIGTSVGLVRFDGAKFTEVPLGRGYTNEEIRVTAICEDNQGFLWIGTQDGLFRLEHGRVFRLTTADGLLDDSVTSLAADGQGLVWIGTRSGLNLHANRKLTAFTMDEGLPDEMVTGVHVARSGTVWITTRSGMCRFVDGKLSSYVFKTDSQGRSPEYLGAYEDRRENIWAFGDTYLINLAEGKRFNYFRGNEATSVRIWSLCEGRDGRLWIGTSGRGLFCFNDNRFQSVVLGDLRWPYDVRAICEDREGNLWLGTSGGGLVQLRPQPVHVMRAGQGLPTALPTALALDANGRVVAGLQRSGLFVGEGGRFERLASTGTKDVQDFISALTVGRDGAVWVGTLGGGLYGLKNGRTVQFTTADGLADDSVLSACTDDKGNVWVGTSAGTVHRVSGNDIKRFDSLHGLPQSAVTAMAPAASGGIWVGTEGGAVFRSEGERFFVTVPPQKTAGRPILMLVEGEQERLWIGTAGAGLACFTEKEVVTWSTRSGLPNDIVVGVVEDAEKNIWLSTGVGIYRVNRSAVQAALQGDKSPLVCKLMSEAKASYDPSALIGGTRAVMAPDGKLWFATLEGVISVDARLPEMEFSQLPLKIESAIINGQAPVSLLRESPWAMAINFKEGPKAPGDVRSFDVSFTALGFTAPERIRFRYKLEGFDSDWSDDTTTRLARYGRLSYGQYQFRVAARQGDSEWREATPFAFEVPTPIYFRTWAIALYVLSAVALVTGIVRMVSHRRLRLALEHLEQQQALERERMRIARDMHDEMGSKLTKISFLSEHVRLEGKTNGDLGRKIESIAETSRDLLKTMDEIVWVVNPHNDTLEHVAAYLSHYADEYFQNTSVECELRLPQSIPHVPLSSETRHNLFLAFEEALNNVLKHSGSSKVKVEMAVSSPHFEILITDNGRGFDMNSHADRARSGNGLKNMQQRLADSDGECVIRSQPGGGTTVLLRVALNQSVTRNS